MKEEQLIAFGEIKARLDNVEEKLREVPTRPELEAFTDALHDLVTIQKEQATSIKAFNDYVNRWKGAALVLVAIGAILTKLSDWTIALLSNHNP